MGWRHSQEVAPKRDAKVGIGPLVLPIQLVSVRGLLPRPVSNFRLRSAAHLVAAAALLLTGPFLGGCSTPVADLPLVGLPENIPPRPATPAAYLPVHDLPAPRTAPVLTLEEQKKIEKELAAARDKQTAKQSTQRTSQ